VNDLICLTIRNIAAMAISLLLSLSWMDANAQETCERTGIEFGFFNGVKTTRFQARDVVEEFLPEQYGLTTPDGQPISYTLYYNDTEGWADFVETFEQRLQEHNGVLSQRFELFFSSLQGGGSWWSHITETVPALGDVLSGIVQTFQAFLTNRLVEGTGDPSTAAVSQRHREQIDHAVAMDKGLLLFAHSQGNLFVNQAYDHARSRVGAESVRVVHVAPPSPRQIGQYTLANRDVVINALRTTGFVLPNSQTILPYAHRPPGLNGQRDFLGHGLLEIYLNPLVPSTSAAIRLHVEQALDELARSRPSGPGGTHGIPLPPYEDLPWRGGDGPSEVWTEHPPSHRLEEVRKRGRFECTVMYYSGYGGYGYKYLNCITQRFDSIHVTGLNIAGSVSCNTTGCRYRNYPAFRQHSAYAIEARALLNSPVGSRRTFSTFTYDIYLSLLQKNGRLGFWNGSNPGDISYYEDYRGGYRNLENMLEIEAWNREFQLHQRRNAERRLRYADLLRAVQTRQTACRANSAPEYLPPDTVLPEPRLPEHNNPDPIDDGPPVVPPPPTATRALR